MKRSIALISTGGTIEKTYDELSGVLANQISSGPAGGGEDVSILTTRGPRSIPSVLDLMLASLELRGIEVVRVQLMNKDSLDMSRDDHTLIAQTAGTMARTMAGVVVVHGTDRLATSGDRVVELVGTPASPIVFTGAMRPWELRSSDALQNLTEALLAVQILAPGVYVAMHNQVLQFPGVTKDLERRTFVKAR